MFKPDSVTATAGNATADYTPHPDGQFVARCVDVLDLGEKVEQFEQNPEKLVRKVMLVFVTGETKDFNGKPELIPLTKEFTLSAHEKAGLRKFCELWRGKSWSEAEIQANGIPLQKLAGQYAVVSVEHKQSRAGRTYAAISGVFPVMKGVAKPADLGDAYERPAWLTDKKLAYASEVAIYKRRTGADKVEQPVAVKGDFTAPPKIADDSDQLPF